jgi:hypothetical protein
VAEKTGRNDPCPCGSGKKYKKCCLERDEAERRESALLDDDLDDDADEFADWEGDADLPPLTADDVLSIGYASGMVKSRSRALAGAGLSEKEWRAPIPQEILDAIDREQAADLEGTWGDPDAATPIQVELIDIETFDGDIITIEVFNRGVLLLAENSEDTRRLHRLSEILRTTNATPVVALPLPEDRLEPDDETDRQDIPAGSIPPVPQPGACELCGADLAPEEAAGHLRSCAPENDAAKGPKQELVHLRVTAPELPWYWLDVEVRANATLEALDKFLRKTWLECCGHLSQFIIGEVDYVRVKSEDLGWEAGFHRRPERSMNARIAKALPGVGAHITYEYDFGTTTTLDIEIVGERTGSIGRSTTRLLARNSPIAWTCATCGEPAAFVCAVCVYDGPSAFACERHGRGRHRCGEVDAFLPVVNSPRMGKCGYTGD